VADDQIEHGISEKLEALVVIGPGIPLLVTPGRMAQRLFEERSLLEGIAEDGL
jgi:hypothetical protein